MTPSPEEKKRTAIIVLSTRRQSTNTDHRFSPYDELFRLYTVEERKKAQIAYFKGCPGNTGGGENDIE